MLEIVIALILLGLFGSKIERGVDVLFILINKIIEKINSLIEKWIFNFKLSKQGQRILEFKI